MLDKILKNLQQAGDALKEQASSLGESAKEKSYQLIEDWVEAIPIIEAYGLSVHSFALGIAISPSLEVEFKGSHEDFPEERIQEILKKHKGNPAITSFFTTMRTTYRLHRKIKSDFREPLIVKVKVRISPEIKVYIGDPLIV